MSNFSTILVLFVVGFVLKAIGQAFPLSLSFLAALGSLAIFAGVIGSFAMFMNSQLFAVKQPPATPATPTPTTPSSPRKKSLAVRLFSATRKMFRSSKVKPAQRIRVAPFIAAAAASPAAASLPVYPTVAVPAAQAVVAPAQSAPATTAAAKPRQARRVQLQKLAYFSSKSGELMAVGVSKSNAYYVGSFDDAKKDFDGKVLIKLASKDAVDAAFEANSLAI